MQFSVSRFGAGKSAPGSVYSEGPALSHDDERTYLGVGISLVPQTALLQVQGSVTFGTDLGSDARPEPVGSFLMRQVESSSFFDTELVEEEGHGRDEEEGLAMEDTFQ